MRILANNPDFSLRGISGYEIAHMYNEGTLTADLHHLNSIRAIIGMAELKLPICLQLVTRVVPNSNLTTSGRSNVNQHLYNGWLIRFMWEVYNKTDSYNYILAHESAGICVTDTVRDTLLSNEYQWLSLHYDDDPHDVKLNNALGAIKALNRAR